MILYNDIYKFNILLMNEIIKNYPLNDKAWKLFKTFYKDPDGYAIDENGFKTRKGVECTVDAIISINRIYNHDGFNQKFIDNYTIYRKNPIIFFPREKGGINTSRYAKFGDRIDHTLFDLKNYFENKEYKLIKSYELPKTKLWLESFDSFEDIVDYMKIDEVFVNEDNEIYDLENNNGEIIKSYYDSYSKIWTKTYYKNVKERIRMFNERFS